MARNRKRDDMTVDELRRLLVEKRRAARKERLERFRRTGRAVVVASDNEAPFLGDLRASPLDDFDDDAGTAPVSIRRRIFDRFLLVIEVLAVVGLGVILLNGLGVLNQLNEEFASALVQPTFTPTPLVMAVILPSGHTPPDSPGGAKYNEAEIPEHLRPLVQTLREIAIPTPGPEHALRIQIPAIDVDAPIVQGDGWEQLKKGVAQHIGTANPGENGNLVLSAHNDIFGEIFRYLEDLRPGDLIILHTNQRTYTYIITEILIVEPTQVQVMDPTRDPTVTLISCYPYRIDNKRIVVIAKLQN